MEKKRQPGKRGINKSQTSNRDYCLFVTLVQCALCAAVFFLLLLLSRGNSDFSDGLRRDFSLLMTRQLSMEDVEDAVGTVRDYFLPEAGTVAVMAEPDGDTTAPETTAQESTTEPESTTKAAEETTEPTQSVATRSLETSTAPEKKNTKKSLSVDTAEKEATASTVGAVPITRPVEGGRYSSYFGYRNNPITHQYAFHSGLDIAVPHGTEIRAAYSGTVRLVGEDSRSGKYVTITHDGGYETFYCHCSKTLVTQGETVDAGEAVACVGSTGWATGPHLHFEIRKDGEKLDPLEILEHDV